MSHHSLHHIRYWDISAFLEIQKKVGLWCLTPLSTIVQLYRGVSFIGEGNQSILRKQTTDLLQVTDKLYHIILKSYIA